jgi:predicted dehydrogenase
MRKLRVGIIGVGAIATDPTHGHIPNYLHIPDVEVVAISDVNGNRAQHIANRYNIPLVYTHFREMLANAEVDAVSIAVPNYLHAAIAVGCLEKGVHVLVEKPMAMTSRDAERMISAARAHRRVLFPGMNNRFREDSRALKLMMQQGALGEVYAAKAGWLSRAGAGESSSWLTSKAQTGGGPLWDTGIVILDLALWMLGFPKVKSVSGAIHKAKGELPQLISPTETSPYPVEDAAMALVRFEDGRHLSLEVSTANLTGDADDIYLRLQGTSGGAELHNPEMKGTDVLRVQGELFGTQMEFAPVLRESGVPSHRNELKHFVDVCLGRSEPQVTPEQGYVGVRVIEAIYESALCGREVSFEVEPPCPEAEMKVLEPELELVPA